MLDVSISILITSVIVIILVFSGMRVDLIIGMSIVVVFLGINVIMNIVIVVANCILSCS